MYLLPIDCSLEDVRNATNEQLWYSFHSEREYNSEVISEIASELTLRGF